MAQRRERRGFRQHTPHAYAELYASEGLGSDVGQRYGVNGLCVAVDPETIGPNFPEYDKLIYFSEQQGICVLLTPLASATNPARSEVRLVVPDAVVTNAMGRLAERYKDRANAIYGLWNEPHPETISCAGYDQQWQI